MVARIDRARAAADSKWSCGSPTLPVAPTLAIDLAALHLVAALHQQLVGWA